MSDDAKKTITETATNFSERVPVMQRVLSSDVLLKKSQNVPKMSSVPAKSVSGQSAQASSKPGGKQPVNTKGQ